MMTDKLCMSHGMNGQRWQMAKTFDIGSRADRGSSRGRCDAEVKDVGFDLPRASIVLSIGPHRAGIGIREAIRGPDRSPFEGVASPRDMIAAACNRPFAR